MTVTPAPRHKPGNTLLGIALLIALVFGVLLLVGLNSHDAYGQTSVSPVAVLPLVLAGILALIGAAQKLGAYLEGRRHE